MVDKTKTIDKQKTDSDSSLSRKSTSKEPPSWSELASKMKVGGVGLATVSSLALGLFLIPSLPIAVFLVSIVLSSFGLTGAKSSAVAGGIAAGTASLFSILFSLSSILLTIGTLGLFGLATIIPTMILGVVAGLIGGYIGEKVL